MMSFHTEWGLAEMASAVASCTPPTIFTAFCRAALVLVQLWKNLQRVYGASRRFDSRGDRLAHGSIGLQQVLDRCLRRLPGRL